MKLNTIKWWRKNECSIFFMAAILTWTKFEED